MIKLIVCCIYRTPSGNLEQLFDLLEGILNYPYQPNLTDLIFGGSNINFLTKSTNALKLETLMNTFNFVQVENSILIQLMNLKTNCAENFDKMFLKTMIMILIAFLTLF